MHVNLVLLILNPANEYFPNLRCYINSAAATLQFDHILITRNARVLHLRRDCQFQNFGSLYFCVITDSRAFTGSDFQSFAPKSEQMGNMLRFSSDF